MHTQPYKNNGIMLDPTVVRNGEHLRIVYDGLLAKSGAEHIYVRIGEGPEFYNEKDIKMEQTGENRFQAECYVQPTSETVNFCFKDCANNWDNNNGKNYIVTTPYHQH